MDKQQIIDQLRAEIEALSITDEPAPDLDAPAEMLIHTRRDTDGNIYGYFPGCTTEGMVGWVMQGECRVNAA